MAGLRIVVLDHFWGEKLVLVRLIIYVLHIIPNYYVVYIYILCVVQALRQTKKN